MLIQINGVSHSINEYKLNEKDNYFITNCGIKFDINDSQVKITGISNKNMCVECKSVSAIESKSECCIQEKSIDDYKKECIRLANLCINKNIIIKALTEQIKIISKDTLYDSIE